MKPSLQQRADAFDLTIDPTGLTPGFCEFVRRLPELDVMNIRHPNCASEEVRIMVWTAHEAMRLGHDYGAGKASSEQWNDAHFAFLKAVGAFLATLKANPLMDDAP